MTERSHIPTALAVATALYLGAIVSANAIAAKLFVVAGVAVTGGALAIPIVYLTTDIINELYGARTTRAVVLMGALACGVLAVISVAARWLPAAEHGASQAAFEEMFAVTWRVALGSTVAYLASSLLDVWLFQAIRRATGERWFWLRKNGSTVVSQAVDTVVFVLIAFAGTIPLEVLAPMALGQYLVKISMAPIGTPLSYLVLRIAR